MVVQKELQVAELEDELVCMRLLYMARVARLAPFYVLAVLQAAGGGVEKCCGGRHGVHVPAPSAQA